MTSTSELIKSLLDDHGSPYDESVIHQLNEYSFKLMKTLISQSSELADLSKRSNITLDDIKLAAEQLQNPQPTPEEITKLAPLKNQQKLTEQSDYADNYGIKLTPNETNKLSKPNYQVIMGVKQEGDIIMTTKPNPQEADKIAPKLGRKKLNIIIDSGMD